MKIKWYGHAAFNIITASGTRIIVDPYQSGAFGGALSYGKISDSADIVLTSHQHDDHNYIKDIKGSFTHIADKGLYFERGVNIRAIPSYHDASRGTERGDNLLFAIDVDGLIVAHLGDLGHTLNKETISSLGKIHVLMLPVGGFYTIGAEEATKVMHDLDPVITIPMHFKTEKCDFPIAVVDDFTKGKTQVKHIQSSQIEITMESLPSQPEIVLLQYAL